ncbi:unnamed protein product [Caenorhabditis auriculariae]|uniref:Uncharacterized protein n=1 Tax=Caenorhabditis auriculariae TaxID=2777116 RepID=A0A8S1GWK6_9PELO|nr:unnamed protein product [Caenorhabditis auriculariae]
MYEIFWPSSSALPPRSTTAGCSTVWPAFFQPPEPSTTVVNLIPLELLFSTTGRVLVDRDTNKIIHLQAMAGGDDELVYPYEKFYPQILAQLKELEILKPKLIEALYNRVGKHARCVQAAMAGVARN